MKLSRLFFLPLCVLAASALRAAAPGTPDDAIFRAMRDELARSMAKLQLETLNKPYYIAYRVTDVDSRSAAATFGALTVSDQRRNRNVQVEVRVGSPELDNTNFYTMRIGTAGVIRISAEVGITIPLDDNYDELRRQLWLATDSAYKQALDDYAKKKAALEHRTRTDSAPDLSKEEPAQQSDLRPAIALAQKDMEGLVKAVSAGFKQSPAIDNSLVTMTVTHTTARYLNTEGTWYHKTDPAASVVIAADTQAPDGMPLADSETLYIGSPDAVPSKDELIATAKRLQDRLTALTQAKPVERYAGPVLFEGQAAAELMWSTLAGQLARMPRPVVDDQRFERMFSGGDSALAERVGQRILPSFLNVVDDATARDHNGQPLWARHAVDDEGVPGQRTPLVEKGVLKGFLNSRALVPGRSRSTGSKRGNGVLPSNLLITADKTIPAAQMKTELLNRVKERGLEYGILIRKIGDPSSLPARGRNRVMVFTMSSGGGHSASGGGPSEGVVEAYKVYPDGREELIRNMEMYGLGVNALKDIVAASDQSYVLTKPFRGGRGPMIFTDSAAAAAAMGLLIPPPIVSLAAPSVILDDLTLQRPSGEVPMLPFGKHPFFSKN